MLKCCVVASVLLCTAPAAAQTTWNAGDCQLTLSADKLTATGPNTSGKYGCRSNTSKASGLVYWQFRISVDVSATGSWQGGLADSSWVLTSSSASPNGGFATAMSVSPTGGSGSTQGGTLNVYGNAVALCTTGGSIGIGSTVEVAADLTNKKIDARRLGDPNWCVSGTGQPNQGSGGTGTIGGTSPWYLSFYSATTDGATLVLGTGTLPTGYSYWDTVTLPPDQITVQSVTRWSPGASNCNLLNGASGGSASGTTGCIIPYTTSLTTWPNAGQLSDPCIVINPSDSSKLIMFFTAWNNQYGQGQVMRLDGTVANPQTSWANPVVVLAPPDSNTYSTNWATSGGCTYQGGKFYNYYVHIVGTNPSQIYLMTSTDGTTWTQAPSNPVLVASGDETQVEDPAVWVEGGTWYLFYSYRTASAVLPGIRYATSTDGVSWTKPGSNQVWNCFTGNHCEGHQLSKQGSVYLMEFDSGSNNSPYQLFLATASSPTGPYTLNSRGNPFLPFGPAGEWDQYHVATGHLTVIGGQTYYYFQGSGQVLQPYGANHWSLGVASVVFGSPTPPANLGSGAAGLRRR